jgi:alpha-galactosidase
VKYFALIAFVCGLAVAAEPGIVQPDPSVRPAIELDGKLVDSFRVLSSETKHVVDPEFGPGEETIETAVFAGRSGLRVERHVRTFVPERHRDATIVERSFRNLGRRPVSIGRVDTQRLLLDRRLAEPDQQGWAFASYQGGAYQWGRDYELIRLGPGFHQSNFQGLDDRKGPEGEGGGMPFIDIWSPVAGVALMHLEKTPQWVSLPVVVRPDGKVEIAVTETPLAQFKQKNVLAPGDTYRAVMTAMVRHHGDSYDALHTYGELLRARGIEIPTVSAADAYEPYWKSWGFGLEFTQKKILDKLPELASMGIRVANLDDGWFDFYGDWNPNLAPGKFPGGERDLRAFAATIHDAGFKTNIWWYPLGVSPGSRLAKEHPDLLVQDAQGRFVKDDREVYQLCPAYQPALDSISGTLRRIVVDWNYDGVYVDSTGLTTVPPCFNPAHHHASPLDSFQAMPKLYERIRDDLKKFKPLQPWYEVCICAMPHSPYYMPYFDVASGSDPVNPVQMRRRVKAEKAIRGPRFCVGDCYQVPLDQWRGSSLPDAFESAFGVGAQLTTFYASLDSGQLDRWRRWFHLYRELNLARGEYLNLYDIAFDEPETHVVRASGALYYGIFADYWNREKPLTLRGLDRNRTYEVYDYAHQRSLGSIRGDQPVIHVSFKESLLLRVTAAPAGGK